MYKKTVKHSFKVFSENLKNNKIDRVILMYGAEQYLVKWAVDTLVHKYVHPASASMDYVVLDEEGIGCDQIIEACETFSMFSDQRIVWVRDFKPLGGDNPKGYTKEDVKRLAEYIEHSNEKTILVFSAEEIKANAILTAALKKNAQCYDFDQIDKAEITSFAVKRFKSAGREISPRNLSILIDATGYFNRESDYRLYHFAQDIQKVIAHSEGDRVTEEDIQQTIHGDMETFVFDMLDGISGNQKDKAFKLLHNMLHSGSDPFSIIGAIVAQFELMLSVREFRDDGMDLKTMHKRLGGSEYRIKKLIPYANKYSVEKLREILSGIYEVDRKIKTGLLDGQMALEMFIASI